jgi:acetyl-CoA carboxylase alpha subunit
LTRWHGTVCGGASARDLTGDGGSGGAFALALAGAGHTWITPDAYFSVIGAAVLKLPPESVPRLADRLHLRPRDPHRLGIVAGTS